jgi:murein DD-endopeptidase MepM/ murein hydrolase activator NlpD
LFKPGDKVYPGDIVGYIGITGNANIQVPHLHLFISANGSSVNPLNILNVIYNTNNANLITPCGY